MGTKLSTLSKKSRHSMASSNSNLSTTTKKSFKHNDEIHKQPLPNSKHSHDNESCLSESSINTAGRSFHHVSNSAYWLPNDNEEMDRLVGQHFAIKSLFGGNIMNCISESIEIEYKNNIVLDLGCGPGTWLMDVATEYPTSQFIGVDMCDIFPSNIRPPNVSFQTGNALERLPFPDNTFDLVNVRLFILALMKYEWSTVIKEIYRVLKPGGFVQMIECGMLERGNEFVKYCSRIFEDVIDNRGQDPYIMYKLESLLESNHFYIYHFERKDIYLGKPDPLSREFLWDVCNIFKAAQMAIQTPLGYTQNNYHQFLDILYKELQKQPDATWSFSVCVGQK
ncbi:S-adenosyl-L-methionine-dependent methyltransferase [Cokeromyces recurvatus]|uniref:S-adenosyl-L-methionine-dependent methyltransferase n=1 Tax=Cokeromyces recurvatus TaxID=90255 RepID=UPI002220956A|nr:S-adenosyl-L-methionine-dependent methyltransferase [Cokeromyces recurvatus]KAI7901596.1 S-adenosyl-L-methionine-dependent methyltransferase [Cokeromyces recurvatus]